MTADPRQLAAIFAGGFVGTIARVELADVVSHGPTSWPWATFAVNLAGAFLIGLVAERVAARPPGAATDRLRLFATTGLCGALTTFSTLQVEVLAMLSHGAVGLAAGYVAASLALGLGAVAGGVRVGRGTRPLDPETERVPG